ncbi:MAG TPA: HAD-IB family hydrolase [Candidatus Paceibacterota bacterium]
MGGKRPVAAFDIDGTIFRSSLAIELADRLVERGVFPKESRARYEDEWRRWRERRGLYEDYLEKIAQLLHEEIKGASYEVVADIAGEIIEEQRHHVYRYTRDLVHELKDKGYYLLAISHSPKFIVDGFGYEMGFDKTYGMFYATGASGRFTGEIEDEEFILNKGGILQRAVHKEGLTLEGSVVVGDTESDIPMLELAETPIAFNPNRGLYREAKRNGWKVVVERKDVVYEL